MQSFQHIFRREGIRAQVVEGDSFHRFNRLEMRAKMKEAEAAGNKHYSHFGPYSNLLAELEALFGSYGASGAGRVRKYIHDAGEAAEFGVDPGCFTDWKDIEPGSDLMFYEGLHGAYVDGTIDVPGTSTCWSAWCRSSTWSGSRSCTATRSCAATRRRRWSTPSCAACRTT